MSAITVPQWQVVRSGLAARLLLWLTPLAVLLRLAVGWRLQALLSFESEEFEYLRISLNLVDGVGRVGMYGGAQVVHSPLYPQLVAATAHLVGRVEVAAVVTSAVMGGLLVIPVYFLAAHLFGRRAAVFSATVTAFLPFEIFLSFQAYSEATFVTLLMCAVLLSVLALEQRHIAWVAAAGIVGGLSYLARPTALILLPLTAASLLIAGWAAHAGRRKIGAHLLLYSVCFILIASPELLYLRRETGHWLLDGKSVGLRAQSSAFYSGQGWTEAGYGASPDLSQLGFALNQNEFLQTVLAQTDSTPSETAEWLKQTVLHLPQNTWPLANAAAKFSLPLLLPLALLGLWPALRATRDRRGMLYVALVFGALLALQAIVPLFYLRYLGPFMPFVILLSGAGYAWLINGLARKQPAALKASLPLDSSLTFVVALLVAGSALLFAPTPRLWLGTPCQATQQAAGRWLATQMSGVNVATVGLTVPYYAGGIAQPLPYSDESTALRYLATRPVTHISVSTYGCDRFPYVCHWVDKGIQDSRVTLIYEDTSVATCHQRIYAWHP